MAFNRRLDSTFPGFGQGLRNDASFLQSGLTLTQASSPQTFPIPASGVLAPTCTAGKLRIKCYNGATGITVTDIKVTATDGTNTVVLGSGLVHPNAPVALTATQWFEWFFEFILDVSGASGGGSGTVGQMLTSIGGANNLNVIISTGTGGTGSMDLDFFPLI